MNGTLKWLRDFILPGVILLWLGSISFDGLFSEAVKSGHAFFQWLSDTISIPRWLLLTGFLLTVVYGAALLYSVIVGRKNSSDVNEVVAGLTEAFNHAAAEFDAIDLDAGAPSERATENIALASEFVQLNENQTLVLIYLGERYMRVGHRYASPSEISQGTSLSLLRAEQAIDQLLGLGLIKNTHRMMIGQVFCLGPIGREWLLAHGYE